MLRQALPSILTFLVLLSQETGARQWSSLPSSRFAAPPRLLRHDFSSKQPFQVLSSVVVGLKGGETKAPEDEEQTEVDNTISEEALAQQIQAGEIARGGSALKTKLKRQKLKAAESQQTEQQIASSSSSNSTVATSDEADVTETAVATPEDKKSKRKKDKFHKKIAKKLKNRNATNKRRKFMHMSFGLFFASLNHCIPKKYFVPGMAVLSSATLTMELLRYRKGFTWMNKALHFVLGKALRKHEMDGKFTGSFYFFTGVTMTAALFPTSSATLGIIQLAIADPSASYFGRATRHVYWSRIENGLGGIGRNKGFLGFLGGTLCCVPFNYRILSIAKFGAEGMPGGKTSLAIASLALGAAGAFADLAVPTPAWTMPKRIWGVKVPPFHADDNVVVPIVSGYACTKIFQVLGWPKNLELAQFIFV